MNTPSMLASKYQKYLKLSDGEVNHKKIKRKQDEGKDKNWKQKKKRKQIRVLIKEDFINKEQSFKWTEKKPITPQLHAQTVANQDQTRKINYYQKIED